MGPMPTRKPKGAPDKARCYEVVAELNRGFEQVLEDLARLKDLRLLRPGLGRALQFALEETRAWSNFEALERLHQREERDWGHYGRLRSAWEKKYSDPQDVLLEAARLRKSLKN